MSSKSRKYDKKCCQRFISERANLERRKHLQNKHAAHNIGAILVQYRFPIYRQYCDVNIWHYCFNIVHKIGVILIFKFLHLNIF